MYNAIPTFLKTNWSLVGFGDVLTSTYSKHITDILSRSIKKKERVVFRRILW